MHNGISPTVQRLLLDKEVFTMCLHGFMSLLQFTIFSDFATRILEQLLARYLETPVALRDSIQELRAREPEPLAAGMVRPNKEDAVAHNQARFIHPNDRL